MVIDELLQIGCVVLSSSRDDAKLVLCVELGWVNTLTPNFVVSKYASGEGNWSSVPSVGAVRRIDAFWF